MNVTLHVDQVDALLEYLMERPAKETINAIAWLSQAKADAEAA